MVSPVNFQTAAGRMMVRDVTLGSQDCLTTIDTGKRGSNTMIRVLTMLFALAVIMAATTATADSNRTVFAPFQTLLERHLQEKRLAGGGLVSAFDYAQALQDPDTRTLLRHQTDALADFDPEGLSGKAETVAFWINAYNAFMVLQILTDQPDGELVSSVWDYGGRVNPFKDNIFQRPLFTVGGTPYSLDQIEKGILLGADFEQKGWKEARVHFAVNCAAVGCPPLRKDLYTADNLESKLTDNTRLALSTPRQLRVDGSTLRLTALFDWYREDFEQEAGSVRQFIRQWAPPEVAAAVSQTDTIDTIDYDWALNRPENFPEW